MVVDTGCINFKRQTWKFNMLITKFYSLCSKLTRRTSPFQIILIAIGLHCLASILIIYFHLSSYLDDNKMFVNNMNKQTVHLCELNLLILSSFIFTLFRSKPDIITLQGGITLNRWSQFNFSWYYRWKKQLIMVEC